MVTGDEAAGDEVGGGNQTGSLDRATGDHATGDRATGAELDETRRGVIHASGDVDPRVQRAWQVWLESLATNAESAVAAAALYGELPGDARDAWLEALAEDAPGLGVPEVAVYGPLLTVERDPERAAKIRTAAGRSLGPITRVKRALIGTSAGGVRLAALVIPLYLDFVRLLVCRFVKDSGFEWVHQDPIVSDDDAPRSGSVIEGVQLFTSSVEAVVDELAHAVLAHRRRRGEVPRLLADCADLFSARLGGEEIIA